MNNLSWFIYLTQIVDHLANVAAGIIVAGVIGGLLGSIFGWMIADVMDKPPTKAAVISGIRYYIITMVVACLMAVFIPSRQTMIMIAGSEIGERMVKSDDVQSVVNPGMDLIRKWIKQESDKIKDKSLGIGAL